MGGSAACVSALLASGADSEITNTEGKTALRLASENRFGKCLKLLRAHADKKSKAQPPAAAPSDCRAEGSSSAAEQRVAGRLPLLSPDGFFDLLRARAAVGSDLLIPEQFSWSDAQLEVQTAGSEEEDDKILDAALRKAAELVVEEGIRDSDLGPAVREGIVSDEENLPYQQYNTAGDDGDPSLREGCGMDDQPPLDEIELAPLVIKWLDKADRHAREMLLSRIGRLARGHRSYALSKRLKNTRCSRSPTPACA